MAISDLPFNGDEEIYSILRITKIKWAINKITYVLALTFIYTLFIAFIQLIALAAQSYASNIWSDVMYTMALTNSRTGYEWLGLYFNYPSILVEFTPFAAFALSFGLIYLHNAVMVLLTLLLSMVLSKALCFGIVITFHAVNYYIYIMLVGAKIFSLFGHSLLSSHKDAGGAEYLPLISDSIVTFVTLIAVLVFAILFVAKKHDFTKKLA